VAVDPEGKVWIQTYLSPDTLPTGEATGTIYVFNADGTPSSIAPIQILSGIDELGAAVTDTLNGTGYGLGIDPSTGNIMSVKWSTRLWSIDYKTGAGVRRIMNPIPGYTSSLAGVAVNSLGEVYLGPVLPGGAVQILNADFSAGTQVAPSVGDYGRTIGVSADGNDVFVPRFTALKTWVYHCDFGSLGPYTLADSIFLGASIETIALHPGTGRVWAAADRRSTSEWTANTYYAYDPTTKALTDSFTVTAWPAADVLPRGLAFSPTGDTAFVGHFDAPTNPGVRRFVWTLVNSVDRVEDAIPSGFELDQNFPNPFNPSTEIRFSVGKDGFVSLRVYDVLGREVQTLVNEDLTAGVYTATFNASSLSTGTYVYVLTAGDVRISKKMLLAK
ncbi:MAG: T9SS type A sorting domain-containing protein, partial [Proteobacteria bacterium]|nr:T9SS type A sorting domain-containing protein [Pseudomonadota bacterium]